MRRLGGWLVAIGWLNLCCAVASFTWAALGIFAEVSVAFAGLIKHDERDDVSALAGLVSQMRVVIVLSDVAFLATGLVLIVIGWKMWRKAGTVSA